MLFIEEWVEKQIVKLCVQNGQGVFITYYQQAPNQYWLYWIKQTFWLLFLSCSYDILFLKDNKSNLHCAHSNTVILDPSAGDKPCIWYPTCKKINWPRVAQAFFFLFWKLFNHMQKYEDEVKFN